MNKRVLLIIVGAIVAVAGFLYLTQPANDETNKGQVSQHTTGAGETGVVLTEFGDFQCPGCGAYYPTLKQVKEKYGDQITFQFRHFPLESIHKNARAAAYAAEAAGLQGKFWEMHDMLFENQTAWQSTSNPVSVFEGYARQIGVEDIDKFNQDYRSSEVNGVVNADLADGRSKGVSATPTFALNGQVLDPSPANSVDAFSALIDQAIKDKKGDSTDATQESNQ